MKTIYQDKYFQVDTFTNEYENKMFSIRFLVDSASDERYRGWKTRKAGRIAKRLRKIAKKLEKI